MSNFNLKTTTALLKKEFIEHKVAFIYVPAILIIVVTLTFFFGMIGNGAKWKEHLPSASVNSTGIDLFGVIYAISLTGWLIFMLIMLFFYFAGSFSADRKDNALLFWKSMPVSDLHIMATKVLAGIIMFPIIILLWSLVAAVVDYFAFLLITLNSPIITAVNSGTSLMTFLNLQASGLVIFAISLLWYLPLFAFVGLLGTLVRGWAVPAFILILSLGSALEALATLSDEGYFSALIDERFKAPFIILSEIMQNMGDANSLAQFQHSEFISVANFAPAYLSAINWVGMLLGWVAAALFIFLASEYRRRRIRA